ncbi:cerebellin-1 [Lates calcarifer]|uniref:Cerebellin-1 n=1 Tax=Lates calcarifer TaxID=8187 RepID=A0AAJ7LCB8_LATCA|nr:cerebellin-1 [Lates calcarifer]
MNLTMLWFVLLLCGLISAQDDGTATVTENPNEIQSCSPDMCDLLVEFGAMREKLRAMETRLEDSETRLRNSETRLRNSETRLRNSETRLNESETRLRNSENQILELRNKEGTKVIFSAVVGRGDKAIGPFNTDITLIYRRVITNIGNAYSQSTGIFTAPVAGVYYFNIFYHAGRAHASGLHLYKNSQVMVMTGHQQSDNDKPDNGGNAVFLQLQRGDQVYVRLVANAYVWGSDYDTTFNGFLVTQI